MVEQNARYASRVGLEVLIMVMAMIRFTVVPLPFFSNNPSLRRYCQAKNARNRRWNGSEGIEIVDRTRRFALKFLQEMQGSTVFDKLVRGLSSDERRELLFRIEQSVPGVSEPLVEEPDVSSVNVDREYNKLSLWQRLLMFVRSLFTGKDREALVHEHLLRELGHDLDARLGKLIDVRNRVFLPAFYLELQELAESVRLLREPISMVMGTQKASFMAYLCGFEVSYLQEEILDATDPEKIEGGNSQMSDKDIKYRVNQNLQRVLDSLPTDARKRMYHNSRALHNLHALVRYPFNDVTELFRPVPDGEPVRCSFEALERPLSRLSGIMNTMTKPVPRELMEAIYLYANQDRIEDDLEERLRRDLQRANEALEAIRQFNLTIPLYEVARFITSDLDFLPESVDGGEDWFAQVRKFWEERVEREFRRFSYRRRRQLLITDAQDVCETNEVRALRYYPSAEQDHSGKFSLSVGVLKSFLEGVFPNKVNGALKTLLIDGEFYKTENRADFTEAYNGILKTQDRITNLETRLRPPGDFALSLDKLKNDSSGGAIVRRKKREGVVESIDREAERILTKAITDLRSLTEVINGILYGEAGGRYDTLSNLSDLGGRRNQLFLRQLDEALSKISSAATVVAEIYDLESLT